MNPINQRLNAWAASLRSRRRRVTAPRIEIFRILASAKNHPCAEEIFERARRRFPTLSRATVYNTLEVLVEAGEAAVLRLDTPAGPARFDGTKERHHHFVCSHCGRIQDLHDPVLDRLPAPRGAGRVESHTVTYRGVCRRCL